LNQKVNYYKHRISYLTGTCYNIELEEFLAWFRVARVCQRQLGILVCMTDGHRNKTKLFGVMIPNGILKYYGIVL